MAHLQFIEDKKGDIVDQVVFCSDYCHQSHPDYDGWNVCIEIFTSEICSNCNRLIKGE